MAKVKEPKTRAPWPPTRAGDPKKLYRYPKERQVGQVAGETFATIAKSVGIQGADLIKYNFNTTDGEEINWYLANYVKAPKPADKEKYYSFFGAPYDSKKGTGVIYIPMYGEPTADPTNRFGDKVAELYSTSMNKSPGGLCYGAAYDRVKEAGNNVGVSLPSLDATDFGRLWGSLIGDKTKFLALPAQYRGFGAAGAMVNQGLGTLVDSNGIWSTGSLKPGAVIQTWGSQADYDSVKDGGSVTVGHSFIFLHYVDKSSPKSGIVYADQWSKEGEVAKQGDWGYWVGANLTTGAAP